MELIMSIIKLEINLPEAVQVIKKFKENRLQALDSLSMDLRKSIESTIDQLLKTEIILFLGQDDQKNNKRNGYKVRKYALKGIGSINLKIPTDRNSNFKSSIIPKNEEIDPRLKEDLAVLHLAGISTRTLSMMSHRLLGIKLSANSVSESLKQVEEKALNWLTRPLTKKYWALYLDGTNFKIQRRGSVEAECSLVVLGIDNSGRRSILAIEAGFKESNIAWEAVLKSLKERGLDFLEVKIGIMDGLPGLEKSFKEHFPYAKTQRCWVHSLKNTLSRVPERLKIPFKELTHKIMYAASKEDAKIAFENLKLAMGPDSKKVINILEKDMDSLLTFFDFDKSYWRALKTTNPIERVNKELKRRTKSMGTLGERTLNIVVAFVALRLEFNWLKTPVNSINIDNLKHVKNLKNEIESTVDIMFH
jgi:transposase-like protein